MTRGTASACDAHPPTVTSPASLEPSTDSPMRYSAKAVAALERASSPSRAQGVGVDYVIPSGSVVVPADKP